MRLTLSQSHFLMALVEWITAKCGRVFSVLIGVAKPAAIDRGAVLEKDRNPEYN
ncbi:hypothetical protein FD10_GL000223 [Lactiplantibacillus argentoratensis DSM 16365]|jgi:hypothetical protein|uniref:Uncharacterized protein n=1 Tax=Lactiplantibacillus argentoratensis TaxID=271881 RepID=A0ABS5UFG3_9LACO|nr:hypothetical protein FD10_GL000223 [Lactiplantibacillus argentoratensis DSM 16365]KZU13199.1 hypothetical protein Nizo2264_1843 [Lactiplantibacillus plantarum]MBT1137326.1 hypothetical protein [Lactiplantibacillus argentoratensis]